MLFQVDMQKTENVLLAAAAATARFSPLGVRKLAPIGGPDMVFFRVHLDRTKFILAPAPFKKLVK